MPIQLIDRGELKREARDLIRSARVSPIRFTLLYLFIRFVLELIDTALTYVTNSSIGLAFLSISFISILVWLVSQVLEAGYYCYCLGVQRREETPYESLFDGFAFAGKVIGLTIVEAALVFLWSLLFVVPGIVAIYRYSFALWNLCEDPNRGVLEALRLSCQQTRGYKWQFFVLQLSFFGWVVLVGIVTSLYEAIAVYLLADTLSAMLLGTALYAVLTASVEAYLTPYYSLSVCGFYRRATAAEPPHRAAGRAGYDPEF